MTVTSPVMRMAPSTRKTSSLRRSTSSSPDFIRFGRSEFAKPFATRVWSMICCSRAPLIATPNSRFDGTKFVSALMSAPAPLLIAIASASVSALGATLATVSTVPALSGVQMETNSRFFSSSWKKPAITASICGTVGTCTVNCAAKASTICCPRLAISVFRSVSRLTIGILALFAV